jgi:hypothetical protein
VIRLTLETLIRIRPTSGVPALFGCPYCGETVEIPYPPANQAYIGVLDDALGAVLGVFMVTQAGTSTTGTRRSYISSTRRLPYHSCIGTYGAFLPTTPPLERDDDAWFD